MTSFTWAVSSTNVIAQLSSADDFEADLVSSLGSSGCENRIRLALKSRQNLLGKPRVLFEPPVVSWAWVRDRENRWRVFLPMSDGGCE
jgi:hypothetical protein